MVKMRKDERKKKTRYGKREKNASQNLNEK